MIFCFWHFPRTRLLVESLSASLPHTSVLNLERLSGKILMEHKVKDQRINSCGKRTFQFCNGQKALLWLEAFESFQIGIGFTQRVAFAASSRSIYAEPLDLPSACIHSTWVPFFLDWLKSVSAERLMRRDLLQISNQTLDHQLDTGEHYEAAFSSRKISKALTGQNGWDIMNTRFTVQYSNKPTLTPVIILFQAKNWTNDLPASELETAFSEMIRVAKQFPDEYYPGRCCGSLHF